MKTSSVPNLTRACLLLGSSLLVMANAAIAPSLTELNHVFDDPFGVSLLMTLPSIAVIGFAPFVSRMIDHLGEKKSLMLGLGFYGVAGSSGLWLDSLAALLVGRVIFGASIVICMTVINQLISDYFSGQERVHFISQQAIAVNLGGIAFVVASGWLASLHWRLPFTIYLIALLTLALSLKGIPLSEKVRTQFRPKLGWLGFRPVLPFYLLGCVGMLSYYLVLLGLPYLLKTSQGFDSSETGLAMGAMSLLSALVAYFFRHGVINYGEKLVMVLCFMCFTTAFLALSQTQYDWRAYIVLVSTGIGFGLLLPVLTHLVIHTSTPALRTSVLSGFVMFYFLGQALSAFVLDLQNLFGTERFFLLLGSLIGVVSLLCFKFVPDLRDKVVEEVA